MKTKGNKMTLEELCDIKFDLLNTKKMAKVYHYIIEVNKSYQYATINADGVVLIWDKLPDLDCDADGWFGDVFVNFMKVGKVEDMSGINWKETLISL